MPRGAGPVAGAVAAREAALAVASIEEASELRDSGIGDAILLLGTAAGISATAMVIRL